MNKYSTNLELSDMELCEHHKPMNLRMGYVAWHIVAQERISQKYTQVFCSRCQRYLFPDELNEPDNPKSIKIIETHKKYLEEHPKAKEIEKNQITGPEGRI